MNKQNVKSTVPAPRVLNGVVNSLELRLHQADLAGRQIDLTFAGGALITGTIIAVSDRAVILDKGVAEFTAIRGMYLPAVRREAE